ncbi:choice-of-anchor A family protein [Sesbania bispinosa]|nr:choice-of-anchor A family protein [Sesbania bispinosa]
MQGMSYSLIHGHVGALNLDKSPDDQTDWGGATGAPNLTSNLNAIGKNPHGSESQPEGCPPH